MQEGYNPTTKYKWFRPRQAAVCYGKRTTPTNLGSVSLFNNTQGAHVIVVRDVVQGANNAAIFNSGIQQGAFGATAGTVQPLIPYEATLPVQVFTNDTATAITTITRTWPLAPSSGYVHDFPIAVLPPGWSFVAQAVTAAQTIEVSFIVECIFAEQLDSWYE